MRRRVSRMRTESFNKYRTPRYPTKLQILEDPQLLEKHIPPAWLSNRELAAVLGLCLAANTAGCAENGPNGSTTRKPIATGQSSANMVAPVFPKESAPAEPVQDRGMPGCIAVAPPVFLSEEEALQVITEELNSNGIVLSERDVKIDSVTITGKAMEFRQDWISDTRDWKFKELTEQFEVDAVDPVNDVAVEYIAEKDEKFFFAIDGIYGSRPAAELLTRQVSKQDIGLRLGTFYHPQEGLPRKFRWARGEERQEAVEECERLLRLQVNDFVDWLKGQGVI